MVLDEWALMDREECPSCQGMGFVGHTVEDDGTLQTCPECLGEGVIQ